MRGWLTFGDIAERCGTQLWRVQRLFDRGLGPVPAEGLGCYRIIPEADLPRVRAALEAAGYLPTGQAPAAPELPEPERDP
jgi:hypothetical protein